MIARILDAGDRLPDVLFALAILAPVLAVPLAFCVVISRLT